MKWTPSSSSSPSASAAMLLLWGMLAVEPAVAMLQCERIVADGHKFDLDKLRGPHSVLTTQHTPPTEQNTTYTLNLCGPLDRKGDVPKGEECPNGSWACAIKRWRNAEGLTGIGQVIPLAGSLQDHGGGPLNHKATRLRTADSNADASREGLRLVLQGGRYPLDGPVSQRQDQRVIVELLCSQEHEGTEGEWLVDENNSNNGGESTGNSSSSSAAMLMGRDLGETAVIKEGPGETQLTPAGVESPALVFQGYDVHDGDGAYGTLRLTWYTRYACENATDSESEHWGFFTWFVILVFLATASYLIFGSWLNYNRYGARGWDLLPHGDMLRDLPYLLQDWVRRLINTLQGSGSRGGYSAV